MATRFLQPDGAHHRQGEEQLHECRMLRELRGRAEKPKAGVEQEVHEPEDHNLSSGEGKAGRGMVGVGLMQKRAEAQEAVVESRRGGFMLGFDA